MDTFYLNDNPPTNTEAAKIIMKRALEATERYPADTQTQNAIIAAMMRALYGFPWNGNSAPPFVHVGLFALALNEIESNVGPVGYISGGTKSE